MSILHSFLNDLRARALRGSQTNSRSRMSAEPLEARIAPAAALTTTMVDTWNDADGDGEVEPGEVISYEVIITNTGDAMTTNGVRFEDLLEANLVLVSGSLNVSPLALDDAYTAVRNTQLQVGPVTGAPTGPQLSVTGSLFDNDREFLSDGYTLSAIGSTTFGGSPTTHTLGSGSTVTIDAEGNFTYLPAAGFAGASETFTYTIRDDGTDGVAGNADDLSSVGTVTINLAADEVWYVDNAYTGANGTSNGTSTRPFTSLGAVTGVAGPDGTGDIIYVASGSGAYTGTMALLNGQKLLGQAVALTIPGVGTLQAAGVRPTINNASGDAVTVNATAGSMQNIEIRGLSLQGSVNAIDITASNFNAVGVTIDDNIFVGSGQEAVDLNAGASVFGVTFTNNTVNASTGNAFDARTSNASAAMTLNVSNNTITSSATGIVIDGAGGGTIAITGFANNTITGNTGGGGVTINSAVFDASPLTTSFQTVNAGTLAIGSSVNAVGTTGLVLTNVRGDLSFSDLDIYTSNGAGLRATTSAAFNPSGTGFQLAVASNVSVIDATGGAALDLDTVLLNLQGAAVKSTNSTTYGVNLVNVDGSTLTTTNSPSSGISGLVGGSSVAFRVVNSTGNITFNGPISTSTGSGVELNNNTGATISLGGTLTISSGTNFAFTATGGGTVNATGTGSTLATTTATALNVVNTNIGASNLTFQSITSTTTSANSGIVLNNTGTSGGLIVTGNGTANSGGTISNKAVDGISLTNTRGVSLSRMVIDNNDGSGIAGTDVTNFSLINSTVSNNADTATGAEAGLRFTNLLGTSAITGSSFSGQSEDHVRITNNTGTLNNLTVSGSTFNANSATTGGHGISMINTGTAVATITVSTTNFTGIRSSAILVNGTDTTVSTLNVTGGTFTDIGSAVTVQSDQSADLSFNVSGITTVRSISNAIQLVAGSTSTPSSNIVGVISNNTIGNGTVDSGSKDMFGVAIDLRGDQDSIISISNNNVRNTDFEGIWVNSADFGTLAGPSARLDLHLRDNTVGAPDDNSAFPVGLIRGVLVDIRHTTTAYLDVSSNTSAGSGGGEGFRFRQRDTAIVHVERLTDGDGTPNELITNLATVQSFFVGQNDPGSTVNVTAAVGFGFTEAADGIARDPLLFLPTAEPIVVTPPPAGETPTDTVTPPEIIDEPVITLPPTAPENPGIADDGILSAAELDTLVSAAIARWAATGLSAEQIALLESVTFVVSDLSGWSLGAASGTSVTLDADAAGNDWFVDETPLDDIEFVGSGSRKTATINGGANGRVDALTTIMHELGHVLGLDDSYDSADRESLMYGWIGAGERRLAQAGEAQGADPSEHASEPVEFIGGPINIGDLPAGKGVTIRFKATVNPAIMVGQVSNQGFVRDSGGVLLATTDDPDVAGAANPTVTLVDLPDVTVGVSAATVAEDGAGTLTYTFTREGTTGHAITVNFNIGGTAASASDFSISGTDVTFDGTTGTIVIPVGSSTATITLSPADDATVEADETAIVNVLAGPVSAPGYDIGTTSSATATILNDDTDVSVAVSPASVSEDGAGNLVYTFTRTGLTSGAHTVNFSLTGSGTLTAADYALLSSPGVTFDSGTGLGTISFAAGEVTKTITLDPTADSVVESDETATIAVQSGTGYNVAGTPAAGTITNDDTDVTLAIAPASVSEDGAGNLVYTFTRNGVTSTALTVNFNVGGTAALNTDYTQTGAATFTSSVGTVTFAAGATTATVTLDPTTDSTVESDETTLLTLTAGTGYNAVTAAAVQGTITNDDTDVSLSVAPASVTEDGAGNLVYTFTRNGVTSNALTVNFSVGGTAAFNTDYTQSGAATFTSSVGTVTFAAGATTATVTIDPTVDSTVESDETAILTITAGTGYNTATPAAATGTIANDDTDVSVAVAPASVFESSGGTLTYTFTRTGVTTGALTVNFNVGGNAAFNTDYTQAGAATFTSSVGTVTFAAGSNTATVTLTPLSDNGVEADETAALTLTTGTGYNVATPSAATGTILNDDAEVTVAVSPASVTEDGAGNLVYTFTRTGYTGAALTVNFDVGGGATFNTDYTQTGAASFGASSGTVTFAAGSTTATVTVDPTADSVGETDETVALTLANGTGYTLGAAAAATGTILNDDTFVSIGLAPGNILEGSASGLVYTITRTGDTSTALTVNFNVAGTAAFTSDYTQSGAATYGSGVGTIVIPAGSASATVTLTSVNDTLVEGDESAQLALTAGAGYSLGATTTATGTLDDNDTAIVRLTSATSTATEGASTPNIGVELVITADGVAGTGTLARAVSVNLDALNSGTAGLADFTFTDPTTVTFAVGQASTITNVPVTIVNDAAVEGDETLQFALNGLNDGTGGSVTLSGATAHTLTITDNDTATIGFAAATANHNEGAGASSLGFILTIIADGTGTPTLARDVTFQVSQASGTAIAGTDYTIATPVTFAAGALNNAVQTTSLTLTNDALVEGSETASFGLAIGSDATGGRVSIATGAAGSHTATIVDNDTATISFATAASTVGEGAGSGGLGFVLSINANGTGTPALAQNVTFNVNTAAGGTANGGADYTVPATVTFAAGAGQGATQSANLAIFNDAAVEGTETASLGLAIATDGTGGQVTIAAGAGANHTTTITDNDTATVRYSTSTSSFSEGLGNGFSVINYVLEISADGVGTPILGRDVTVGAVAAPGGTADASDYTLPLPKTFTTGSTNNASHVEYLGIVNDTVVEGLETVTLGLAIGADGTGGQVTVAAGPEASHTATIGDNDTARIQFVQSAISVGEEIGTHNVGVVLTITANGVVGSGTLGKDILVPIEVNSISASEGIDYSFVSTQSVQFVAGSESSSQFAQISINNDTLVEGAERLSLGFGQFSSQASIGPNNRQDITIADNDTARIEFAGASTVTNENAGTHRVDVRLIITANGEVNTGSLAKAITVTLPESGGDTAVLGQDYTLPSNTLVFAAGATSSVQGMDVGIINDARVEGSETIAFGLQITVDGTNGQASLGTETTHTVTIGDNDIATLSLVSDGSTVGEAGGTHNIGVALVITANGEGTPMLERNVSVNLRDLGLGTAAAGGSDYNFTSPQTITFVSGDTDSTKNFTVGIVDDTRLEGNETIAFTTENFTDGTAGQVTFAGGANHNVTILENETATIALSANGSLIAENAGTLMVGVSFVITANGVVGSGTLDREVSVTLTDLPGTATSGGVDYTFVTPPTIVFSAVEGVANTLVPITIHDDLLSEGNETFRIQLGALNDPTGRVTPSSGVHLATIIDNDIDLQVVKTASTDEVVAGSGAGNLTYTITVTNTGLTDATGIVLAEDLNLPSGVSIVSITPSVGAFETGTAPDGTWTIGSLANDASATLTVILTVDASTAQGVDLISNTATIAGSNEVRVNTEDDADTVSTAVDRQVDLVIEKTDGIDSTIPGAAITYTINYRNDGVSNATGVFLTEFLPTGTAFNAAASSAWVEVAPGIYRLDVGTLAASGSGTANFAVTVNNPVQAGLDTIVNDAAIADDATAGADLNGANNVVQDTDTLNAAPDLQISIDDAPAVAIRGGTTSYTVSYLNVGNQDATGVTITMTLPANTVFDPFASTGIWEFVSPGVFSTVVGDVEAGAVAGSVIFAVRLDSNAGSDYRLLTTTGTIADDGDNGLEPTPVDNTDTESTPLYQGIYAVSPGVSLPGRGNAPVVRVFDVATNTPLFEINAYDPSYRGSIRIAMGDINGDGFDDIITSTRKGTGSVRVFDGRTGDRFEGPFSEIAAFTEKGAKGAFVASGDVTGDGRDDIIVGSGQGARGAGKVKVFDGRTGELVSTAEPFGARFRGGVRVAAGDVNGDGLADIIAAQGVGGNNVKVTSGTSTEVLHDLEIGSPRYRGGVFVAAADLNSDGSADLIVGRDRGLTVIDTFNGETGAQLLAPIVPFAPKYRLGARVAAADINFDGVADIIAGSGGRNGSQVKFFDGTNGAVLHTFTAFPSNLTGSLFVAGTSPVPSVAPLNEQPA